MVTLGGLRKALTVTMAVTLLLLDGHTLSAAPLDPVTILVKNFMFAPMSLTVKAGSTVNWMNKDDEPHSVVSDTALFRSGAIDTNETFSFKFDKPGTYHFTCSIHPRMVGAVVVQ